MTISAMSTTSTLDIIPVLAPFSDRILLPGWCPNWFALDESSVSRQTNYLLRKSGIFSKWGGRDYGESVPHLTTVGTEAKFTVEKGVLYDDILRLKGLLLDHIAAIIPSNAGNGKGISVDANLSLSGTSESNPYGTELGLLTAIYTRIGARAVRTVGFLLPQTSPMIMNMQGGGFMLLDRYRFKVGA
jgi:hypothetical protein